MAHLKQQLCGMCRLEVQRAIHRDLALAVGRVEQEVGAVRPHRGSLQCCVRLPGEQHNSHEEHGSCEDGERVGQARAARAEQHRGEQV